jgi:hypothetical protein
MNAERTDALYDRAIEILDGRHRGLGEPILWHLALRRHADAMLALATRVSDGKASDSVSRSGLERRAFRLGSARAAQHAAMSCFNRGDIAGYRSWLCRGDRSGDLEAIMELRRFEIRLPHAAAGRIGRIRPYRATDGWWTANRQASRPTKYYPPDRYQRRANQ